MQHRTAPCRSCVASSQRLTCCVGGYGVVLGRMKGEAEGGAVEAVEGGVEVCGEGGGVAPQRRGEGVSSVGYGTRKVGGIEPQTTYHGGGESTQEVYRYEVYEVYESRKRKTCSGVHLVHLVIATDPIMQITWGKPS